MGRDAFDELGDFAFGRLEPLLDQESPVKDRAAEIGDARGLDPVDRLSALDAVDVDRRPAGARRHDRHRRTPRRQHRRQILAYGLQEPAHALNRADTEERHAAVTDPAACRHLEPVDTAMPDTDAIDVMRLGDDHKVGAVPGNPPAFSEVGDPGEAAALFVHGAADLDRARQHDACPLDGFGGKHRRGDAGLHVAHAAPENLAVPYDAAERVDRPSVTRGNDVDVAVEVDDGPRPAAPRSDRVHTWMPDRMLRAALCGDVLDVEPAQLFQEIAEKMRARFVVLAGRVHRGYPDETRREGDDFVRGPIDLGNNPIDLVDARHAAYCCPKVWRGPRADSAATR